MGQIKRWERAQRPSGRLDRRLLRHLLIIVPARLRWTTVKVHRWGRGLRTRYWLAFPLIVGAALAHWLGTLYELAFGRRDSGPSPIELWETRAPRSSSETMPTAPAALAATMNGTLSAT